MRYTSKWNTFLLVHVNETYPNTGDSNLKCVVWISSAVFSLLRMLNIVEFMLFSYKHRHKMHSEYMRYNYGITKMPFRTLIINER